MNINKGDEVFAIYQYGDNNEFYEYRKEKFIKYYNGYPFCTVDLQDGVSMGYDEIYIIEKDAISRISKLENK